jgi:radical SAM PhpK family P-methyltransferase
MTDCLIIGFNDSNFEDYVKMVRSMGEDTGAFRDLNLAFVEHDGKPQHALDILTGLSGNKSAGDVPYHNTDFFWPTLTYLGTYLHRHGYTFDYVNLFQQEKELLREKLLREDILTVAITTTLYVSIHPILEIIQFIREHNQTARIIVGGPYVANQCSTEDMSSVAQVFEYMGADFYVINSEGETALVDILSCLKKNGDRRQVHNIAFKEKGSYVSTQRSIETNPLEEHMVDYSLFPAAVHGEFTTLRTAKSCPFSCSFCGFSQRAGKYKYLSVDLVERELDAIREIGGVTTLTFIDDTFNVPKARFKDLLRMMIRNDYNFKWNSFYRSDHGDEEAIELMAAAGCEGVFLGVESGSDAILEKMNKSARRKDYLTAIPLLKQAGISTHCNLIIGYPGETEQTVVETVELIETAAPDYFRAQCWYCDPLTPIWEERGDYDIQGSSFNWSHKTMDYTTACAIVDDMFCDIRNSTWLPQHGFEMWSLFYLKRKGMSRSQIRRFLTAFNQGIKDRLQGRTDGELLPETLRELEEACQFEPSATHDLCSRSGETEKAGGTEQELVTASAAGGRAGTTAPMTLEEFDLLDD